VYVGDLHGRLWKFLSGAPTKALLMADLGSDQAVGVPPALLALGSPAKPLVYVSAGNDERAVGPFKFFGFRDDGSDTAATYAAAGTKATADPTVVAYSPAVYLFSRPFGDSFRGTVQPATALTGDTPPKGRVFFAGTHFVPTGPGVCVADFDSILFALGAETGGAAYDLGGPDSAFRTFENSRIMALQILRGPAPAGSAPGTAGADTLAIDQGLLPAGALIDSPPPPGLRPKTGTAVGMAVLAGRDSTGRPFPHWSEPRVCR
jgi:hypothetical protein